MRVLTLWLGLSVLQAMAMVLDEYRFHRRRGLGHWESWSHSLDAAFWIALLAWIRFFPIRGPGALGYLAMVALSCLSISKDEWVHARECGGGEQWLHSVLFMLHPTLLALGGAPVYGVSNLVQEDGASGVTARRVLELQIAITAGFAAVQYFHWKPRWTNAGEGRQ